jgi:chromate transporter
MQNAQWLKGGLAALTAAIVGVIANLSVWFALHVLFRNIGTSPFGPIQILTPDWTSFDWKAGLLSAIAAALIFRLGWNVVKVLALVGLCGLLLGQIG